MMNLIVGLVLVALGTFFALWPRALWWFRWGWLLDREPSRIEQLLARVSGVIIAAAGLTLTLSDYLYQIF